MIQTTGHPRYSSIRQPISLPNEGCVRVLPGDGYVSASALSSQHRDVIHPARDFAWIPISLRGWFSRASLSHLVHHQIQDPIAMPGPTATVQLPLEELLVALRTSLRALHAHYRTNECACCDDSEGATEARDCIRDVETVAHEVDGTLWNDLLAERGG